MTTSERPLLARGASSAMGVGSWLQPRFYTYALDRVGSGESERGGSALLYVKQASWGASACQVAASSVFLAKHLELQASQGNPHPLRGKRVLELGDGEAGLRTEPQRREPPPAVSAAFSRRLRLQSLLLLLLLCRLRTARDGRVAAGGDFVHGGWGVGFFAAFESQHLGLQRRVLQLLAGEAEQASVWQRGSEGRSARASLLNKEGALAACLTFALGASWVTCRCELLHFQGTALKTRPSSQGSLLHRSATTTSSVFCCWGNVPTPPAAACDC